MKHLLSKLSLSFLLVAMLTLFMSSIAFAQPLNRSATTSPSGHMSTSHVANVHMPNCSWYNYYSINIDGGALTIIEYAYTCGTSTHCQLLSNSYTGNGEVEIDTSSGGVYQVVTGYLSGRGAHLDTNSYAVAPAGIVCNAYTY